MRHSFCSRSPLFFNGHGGTCVLYATVFILNIEKKFNQNEEMHFDYWWVEYKVPWSRQTATFQFRLKEYRLDLIIIDMMMCERKIWNAILYSESSMDIEYWGVAKWDRSKCSQFVGQRTIEWEIWLRTFEFHASIRTKINLNIQWLCDSVDTLRWTRWAASYFFGKIQQKSLSECRLEYFSDNKFSECVWYIFGLRQFR